MASSRSEGTIDVRSGVAAPGLFTSNMVAPSPMELDGDCPPR